MKARAPWTDWMLGELLGTFVLVFVGLSAVALATTTDAFPGVFPVAMVWGMGLAIAIVLAGPLSGAHLNPAITLAFWAFTEFPARRVPYYLGAQFAGAFVAAAMVYAVFGGFIRQYEVEREICRGEPESEATAMIFGEYFPNPGGEPLGDERKEAVGHGQAVMAEIAGTFLLAAGILAIVSTNRLGQPVALAPPLMIGLLLATLICLFGPVTMACFNPARDLAPRLFSVLAGWGSVPFETNGIGWLTVYLLSPCLGAFLGAWCWDAIQKRLQPEVI